MRNDNTNIEALCESTRNSIEAITEESVDERSGESAANETGEEINWNDICR